MMLLTTSLCAGIIDETTCFGFSVLHELDLSSTVSLSWIRVR